MESQAMGRTLRGMTARWSDPHRHPELWRPLGASPTHRLRRQLEDLLARPQTGSRKGVAALLGIQTKTVHSHLARLSDRGGRVDEAMARFTHRDDPRRLRAS
jgi:hypothetical protein